MEKLKSQSRELSPRSLRFTKLPNRPIVLFMHLKKILKTIYEVSKELDVEVYVVGGFVRDELLGGRGTGGEERRKN